MRTVKSTCCSARAYIHSAEEGTTYYVCSKCEMPTDKLPNKKKEKDPEFTSWKLAVKESNFDDIMLSLKELHAKISLALILLVLLAFSSLGILLK